MTLSPVGVSGACTRQKAGRPAKLAAATPGGAPGPGGSEKPPAGTATADVIVPSATAIPASSPQSFAAAGIAAMAASPAAAIASRDAVRATPVQCNRPIGSSPRWRGHPAAKGNGQQAI
jgi:hypothetical protein